MATSEKHWNAWVEDRQKKGLKGQDLFSFAQAKVKEFERR